jgi:hypothetical protein
VLAKTPHITIHHGEFRENRVKEPVPADEAIRTSEEINMIEQNEPQSPPLPAEPDTETLYALELDKLLDEYTNFTRAYKDITRLTRNPFRLRKQAASIFKRLIEVGEAFNARIKTFRKNAVPPDDMKELHETLLESLKEFENYNWELPKLAAKGSLPKIIELSKGLERGQKGVQSFFKALEEREKQKNK